MSQIIKTEAVVLSKLNYGDTSSIVNLYTKDYGKLSALLKGGRNPKSKYALIVDILNHLQIVVYKKENRDLQILSSADLITHFKHLKSDLESAKYSFAVLELVNKLTSENESNEKLFSGILRIMNYMEESKEHPAILYGRFFIFFLKELGYEINLEKCGFCKNPLTQSKIIGYNLETGFVCETCLESHSGLEYMNLELFKYLSCLKFNKSSEIVGVDIIEKSVIFLERYLKYHIPDFKGLQSLKII